MQAKGYYSSIPNLTPVVAGYTGGYLSIQPQLEESWCAIDSPPPTPSMVEKAALFVTYLKATLWRTTTWRTKQT